MTEKHTPDYFDQPARLVVRYPKSQGTQVFYIVPVLIILLAILTYISWDAIDAFLVNFFLLFVVGAMIWVIKVFIVRTEIWVYKNRIHVLSMPFAIYSKSYDSTQFTTCKITQVWDQEGDEYFEIHIEKENQQSRKLISLPDILEAQQVEQKVSEFLILSALNADILQNSHRSTRLMVKAQLSYHQDNRDRLLLSYNMYPAFIKLLSIPLILFSLLFACSFITGYFSFLIESSLILFMLTGFLYVAGVLLCNERQVWLTSKHLTKRIGPFPIPNISPFSSTVPFNNSITDFSITHVQNLWSIVNIHYENGKVIPFIRARDTHQAQEIAMCLHTTCLEQFPQQTKHQPET